MSQPRNGYEQLPWWKRITLDDAYRRRIMKLATQRYREELHLLQEFPHDIAPAAWDDGRPIPQSSQHICVEDETRAWATKHPESIVKVSGFQKLQNAAVATVISGPRAEEHEACILEEVRRLYKEEKASERLYGLSYFWNRQLPPNGFIRVWPSPLSAMWPSLLISEPSTPMYTSLSAPGSSAELPLGMDPTCMTDPLFVHVYRRNGEYLGVWRQSLFLIRYKVICWALHEEERRRTCGAVGRPVLVSDKAFPDAATRQMLKNVPEFQLPLLRLQRETVTFSTKTCRLNLQSLGEPITWEGIVPAPSTYRAEQAYLNWHSLHRSSAVVRQAVRDVFNLLPKNEDGLITKATYVEFFLDLLNLFFPMHISSSSISIAEEEWVYRGTTELMRFETFYEKFFSFPFIFFRDLSTVTRDQYVEVWCLIRVCLLEDEVSVLSCLQDTETSGSPHSMTSAGFSSNTLASAVNPLVPHRMADYSRTRRPKRILEATLSSLQKLKDLRRRKAPPLIGKIWGISDKDILRLGETTFHNTDNYPLYGAKQLAAVMVKENLRELVPSHAIAVVHAKGMQLLAETSRARRRQQLQEELQKKDNPGRSIDSEYGSVLTNASLNKNEKEEEEMEMEGSNDLTTLNRSNFSKGNSLAEKRKKKIMGWSHRTKERHATLEHIEEARKKKKLIETSVFYRHRRLRRHAEHAKILSHISRSHTAWEVCRHDIYEIPPETLDEEDKLLAFVQDLPDDFFDDENSLRVRYGIHAALLKERAERSRNHCPIESVLSTSTTTLTSLRDTPNGNEQDSISTYMHTTLTADDTTKSGGSRGGAVSSVHVSRTRRRSPHGGGASRMSTSPGLTSLVGDGSPLSSSSSSLCSMMNSSSTLPSLVSSGTMREDPPERRNGSHEDIRDMDSLGEWLKRKEELEPRRALYLRLNFKHNMDVNYKQLLQKRPHRLVPFSMPTVRKRTSSKGAKSRLQEGLRPLGTQQTF
ncbi:hypothetical protein MOQ_009491 [Trypanosoma cruzi marinkellei]|uniref:Uncharacterized protein n=1 Tax=Trypanosoma cruzi marinkellei TaxID=85056 RepID=K2NCL6_TRYCR|nr:hypothetical protein MOQ_009491 [Trypanosoma cruzi marinkellei]